ncbi:hypothetical protein [Desulfobacter postgatei]|uniref:Antitoxin SocA-like Panacea domain-containing protein n=1 Tax=Desulfobacter postgatei 2ac9 TaxID=879212 RepID=I5AXX1_9BACT|nr:hypothetical protein [Desulfobacter postgatei]EIM62084.1 hypothetical protein DespoDRAFT_00031 [Desulfobacter postgatei 2ac9]
MKKALLKHVLSLMKQKRIPLTKINIQKIVHFLKETGTPLTYKFEPYNYGPYSSELKVELGGLLLWEELSVNGNEYIINDTFKLDEDIDQGTVDSISDRLDAFKKAVNGDFSFDSMEITGTVIYCNQALKNVGILPNEQEVLKEFKNWKGQRYADERITRAYSQISPLLN